MNSGKMIIKYILKSKKNFIIAFIFQTISVLLSLIVPILIGKLIGSLSNDPAPTSANLWGLFGLVILIGFIAFLVGSYGRIKTAVVSSRAILELRSDINSAIYRQSFSYFDKVETGQLVARATSDVDQTQQMFGFGFVVGMQSILQLIGILISVFILDLRVAIIFFTLIPISLITTLLVVKKLKPIFLETRETFGQLTTTIQENILGSEVVRVFSTQEKERKKFEKSNKGFYDASVKTVKLNSALFPLNVLIIGLIVILTMFVGGYLIIQGQMELSTLISFQFYSGMIMFPLVIFGQISLSYVQADAALIRINEVMESTPDVKNKEGAISIDKMNGLIKFNNVSFGYTKDNRILKNISFEVPAGKKLAILGTTGSGKSTIINLLPRFYDVNEGEILIDDKNIQKYLLKDLRKNIGIVSQETFLFNKSIKENIAFGKENASNEEIVEAAKTSNLHKFIETLPNGYDTIVGERGARLSGGQKQRMSIARALLIKPSILIFDDSTSSVDVETEYKIQVALDKIMKDTTTLIITQRISTIRNADNIMVLDKGVVIGIGAHEELIENNALYRQIYETLHKKQKNLSKSNASVTKKAGGF